MAENTITTHSAAEDRRGRLDLSRGGRRGRLLAALDLLSLEGAGLLERKRTWRQNSRNTPTLRIKSHGDRIS